MYIIDLCAEDELLLFAVAATFIFQNENAEMRKYEKKEKIREKNSFEEIMFLSEKSENEWREMVKNKEMSTEFVLKIILSIFLPQRYISSQRKLCTNIILASFLLK